MLLLGVKGGLVQDKITRMRTRTEKWRRYREKIEALDESRFPRTEPSPLPLSEEDRKAAVEASQAASLALPGGKNGRRPATPYGRYLRRERAILILEMLALLLAIVALLLMYFLWVKA